MQLVVETTGVADWFPVLVPPPQGGGRRLTVRTACPLSSGRRLKSSNHADRKEQTHLCIILRLKLFKGTVQRDGSGRN